ncbi:G-type lectin S-receptor-like serine/threonine-protein kinase LECRK3 [Cucurbita moschata]|uniref:Receptor-like serine/threonine-protein kinase n=2 Tax=Cucurbita TaxID=3660 RepID=A0A6J1FHB0_CUCMO|nr:G-type lectin S-receptor-like serine/threonine-protein kinase LECRK3 [Cucurbita moschata]
MDSSSHIASHSMASSSSFPVLLLHLLLLLLPSFSISQPHKNITLGSSLTANPRTRTNNGDYWSSPSGHFAFGFLQFGNHGFLLAIWFNKIPERTVVWSANRNELVPHGSTVQLTSPGQLLLKNSRTGNQVWSANSPSDNRTLVSYAAMLDTGNFVLASNDSQILWQSFDEPTDTILPSQIMNQKSLIASQSATNFSEGRFQFSMQSDGNLVLNTRIAPLGALGTAYWASDTVNSGFQLVFNLSGSVYISAKNGTIISNLTSSSSYSNEGFYHRAILDYDGVFSQYVYPKSENATPEGKSWISLSDFIPSNICDRIVGGLGSGVCGYNSYCETDENHRPCCKCPQGYRRVDPKDEMKGCSPNFVPQTCEDSDLEANKFDFSVIDNADWPKIDYMGYSGEDEDWCRTACLNDCFCAAVISESGNCWMKKFPLSFGRVNRDYNGKSLIKYRKDNSSLIATDLVMKYKDKTFVVIGLALIGGSGCLIFMFLLVSFPIVCRKSKNGYRSLVISGKLPVLGMNLRSFSYEELNKATNGFKEKLGSGAFATVYKGIVDSMDNGLVAVKLLDNTVKEADQEFKAEVGAIARTNHKNLVRLLGFCNEQLHRLLVYEFMPNGSLADFLYGPPSNWNKRIHLAIGTARGLNYLHEECKTQIIHCDIKPQNILIDDTFSARIADFGLAKLLKKDQTRTVTAIRGTKGYVAPEWFRNLPITVKVDVYSFGIVLLEIVCCRRSFEMKAEAEDEMVLADWAYDCLISRKVERLVRKDEEAKKDMKMVEKLVTVAIWCIQEEPSFRPSMKKVLQMLEGVVEVPAPPHPSSFITTI